LAIADFGFGINEHLLKQDNPKSAIPNPHFNGFSVVTKVLEFFSILASRNSSGS